MAELIGIAASAAGGGLFAATAATLWWFGGRSAGLKPGKHEKGGFCEPPMSIEY